jgi:hypothetical protein
MQLKGNPGGRVTKSEAQSLIPQLIELVDIPVPSTFMSHPDERHEAVFVTNGEIDEEARLLIEQLSRRTNAAASPAERLSLWSRGDLLSRIRSNLSSIWPASLEGIRLLLDFQATSGDEIPDVQTLSSVLSASIGRPSATASSPEKTSKLTSCLLLAEVIKAPWRERENHYSLYVISVLASTFCLRYADNDIRKAILDSYLDSVLEHCADLLREAQQKKLQPGHVWGERDFFGEFDIMTERERLVSDCAATLLLSGRIKDDGLLPYCRDLLASSFGPESIWGHGAVPAAIVRAWAMRKVDASIEPERVLYSLLASLLHAARDREGARLGLPAPYFDFEACLYLHSGGVVGRETEIGKDSMWGRAWYTRALFFMLAKRNMKRTCKRTWPEFAKVMHEEPDYPASDFFDATLSREGRTATHQFIRADWAELVRLAVEKGQQPFLDDHRSHAWLIAAYIALVPYRAWDSVLLWLDTELNQTWYSRDHLPS